MNKDLPARQWLHRPWPGAKRYAAQQHPLTDTMMTTYLVLTVCAASILLVCAQEVVPAPNPLSARRPLRPTDRLRCADHSYARETRACDYISSPEVHASG